MNPYTSAPAAGDLLEDRYELVRHIARGGMGDVFEARDRVLQRAVAVKLFRATAPADRSRFDAEVTTLAALNHPGLVQVYDAGEHRGEGFVVLELVDGPNLRTIIAQRGALPPSEVAALGAPVADALAYVHANGVVHRDVTPANVLCGPDGRPRLADFGIARLLDTSRITAVASTIGTAAYMAPEQVEGRDVTPAADVYALGLVLLEALTGRRAFEGPGHEAAIARLARDPDTDHDVPPAWQPVLREMTHRDPAARPTAATVAARLDDLAAGAPAGQVATAPMSAVAGPSPYPTSPRGRGVESEDQATTEALGAVGGTTVMPATMLPQVASGGSAAVGERAGEGGVGPRPTSPWARPQLWLALGVIALVVALGLASRGGRLEVPADSTRTTTSVAPVVTSPPTTAPPPATSAAPPATEKPPKGGGDSKGKGHKD